MTRREEERREEDLSWPRYAVRAWGAQREENSLGLVMLFRREEERRKEDLSWPRYVSQRGGEGRGELSRSRYALPGEKKGGEENSLGLVMLFPGEEEEEKRSTL